MNARRAFWAAVAGSMAVLAFSLRAAHADADAAAAPTLGQIYATLHGRGARHRVVPQAQGRVGIPRTRVCDSSVV
jgi:hypothetical protein